MAIPLGRTLLERRIPQYLAAYLGVSWGIIEFFAFLEDRFLLSPYLTNLVMVTLALLLPSAVLVIYFHGRAGRDPWHRVEKVGIPTNLALAGVVLFGTFGSKDLGAVTTTVRVQDEQGNAVERMVVKDEFRKGVVLFTPYADSTDPSTAWLGAAVWNGLVNDLYQDAFLDVRASLEFRDRIREAGFSSDAAMPRSLKRAIVTERHLPYFVDGTVARVDSAFRLSLALNDAARGRVVGERAYQGADLFALIDSASVQLDSALAADPTYADAAFTLYQVSGLMGDVPTAMAALQTAMDNLYRLPERAHYQVKGEWYAIHQELPKAYAVYEMWAELYPQDITAQELAAQVRGIQNDKRGVLRAYEAVLKLDPTRIQLLLRIGALHETLGDVDAARTTYEHYLDAAPADVAALTALAGLDRRTGDHEKARELYERAQLLKPGDVAVAVALASLDRDVGRFEEALAGYEAALAAARTAQQRNTVLSALSGYYRWRGAMSRALEYNERALKEAASFMPP
ncbi:MAG TPA: hypothetical protein VJ957_01210, partial [Longimicrobiales bacterium]|nr:hypothetical protein [Longimicrobiales bacterium]